MTEGAPLLESVRTPASHAQVLGSGPIPVAWGEGGLDLRSGSEGDELRQKDGRLRQGGGVPLASLALRLDVAPQPGVGPLPDELLRSCAERNRERDLERVFDVGDHLDEHDFPHLPASWRQTLPPIRASAWGQPKAVGHQFVAWPPQQRQVVVGLEDQEVHFQEQLEVASLGDASTEEVAAGAVGTPTSARAYGYHE